MMEERSGRWTDDGATASQGIALGLLSCCTGEQDKRRDQNSQAPLIKKVYDARSLAPSGLGGVACAIHSRSSSCAQGRSSKRMTAA